MKQRTVQQSGEIKGIGLHSGETITLRVKPTDVNSGISFLKSGRRLGTLADLHQAGLVSDSSRCTGIGNGADTILTLEHFLAAVNGLGITNLSVDVDGSEVPGLDGSSSEWVRFLKGLGTREEAQEAAVYQIKEPIFIGEGTKAICAFPAEHFSVSYVLDYDHPALRGQLASAEVTEQTFETQIAPARTFCTEAESHLIRQKGLGKGANFKNTLVMSDKGPIENKLQFENEAARHKILDILGDLMFTGFPIQARVVGIRSGHAMNARLVREIVRQKREAL